MVSCRRVVDAGKRLAENHPKEPLDRREVRVVGAGFDDDKMQHRGRSFPRLPLGHDPYPLPVPKCRWVKDSTSGPAGPIFLGFGCSVPTWGEGASRVVSFASDGLARKRRKPAPFRAF